MIDHLTPEHWTRANRHLVTKALAEFAHERLITPEPLPDNGFRVTAGEVEFTFRARRSALDHWRIDANTVRRHERGVETGLDAVRLVIDLRVQLGLTDDVLPVYMEELTSTLSGIAYKIDKPSISAAELSAAPFQRIETEMTEGHPCFVANNGRLGFDAAEYHDHAPETASAQRLLWLAARADRCIFAATADCDYEALVRSELGAAALDRFAGIMRRRGLDLAEYRLIPVHPWQWHNRLAVTYAGEVARQRLVCLGFGDDEYLAQQSIRTFFNVSEPEKHYVKTALSVLNMGFMRGLSADYMAVTPAINEWLADLIGKDDVLQAAGFTILRERAAIGYRHEQYEAIRPAGGPYRKMLAALWRESPIGLLDSGERLATMASLLHVDRAGESLAAALIRRSELDPTEWVRRYLDAYLVPVLHCFYAYDLVFMPHGENVILVLDDDAPVRAIFKDIGEEIAVLDPDAPLPADVRRIRADVPDELKTLSIFTDVFDCFLRFLGDILDAAGVVDEDAFWDTVADCVLDYQHSVPELADKFARYDLFVDEFPLSCLNRLQLRNNRQMVDLADPASALCITGSLPNPISGRPANSCRS